MGGRTRAVGAALVLAGILTAVILGAPAAGAAGGEGPVTVPVGFEPPVGLVFGVLPKRLPTGEAGVTRLDLGLEEAPSSEGIPPGIATTEIDLGRSIALEPRGLPVCYRPEREGGGQIEPTQLDIRECDSVAFLQMPETSARGHILKAQASIVAEHFVWQQ